MKKTVIITGSNGSLGYEIAKRFDKQNFNLILHARKNSKKLINLKKKNKLIKLVNGDLSKNKNILKIVRLIEKKDFNILINNSAIYIKKPFKNTEEDEIFKVFKSNFFSNLILLNKIIKKKIKRLLVVNINSVAGLSGSANESLYSASKHALKGFYDSIEKEPNNTINIMNIYSGAFKSKITKRRKDFSKLMDPSEIADIICKNLFDYNSLSLNNIYIKRKKY